MRMTGVRKTGVRRIGVRRIGVRRVIYKKKRNAVTHAELNIGLVARYGNMFNLSETHV